jgi:F420H(2)-dependent quinone reductase
MDHLSAFERSVGLRLVRIHELLYKKTNGRIGHRIPGIPTSLLLRTIGARSRKDRTDTLTYARDGEDYLVVASMGGAPKAPAWYHNLKAQPQAEITVGAARLAVHARAVKPDDLDYARFWRIVNEANADHYNTYQRRTTRPIAVVVLAPFDRSPEAGRGSTVGA